MFKGVQYITDDNGSKTGVLVSLKKWQAQQKELEKYRALEAFRKQLRLAYKELNAIHKGRKEAVALKQFLHGV